MLNIKIMNIFRIKIQLKMNKFRIVTNINLKNTKYWKL